MNHLHLRQRQEERDVKQGGLVGAPHRWANMKITCMLLIATVPLSAASQIEHFQFDELSSHSAVTSFSQEFRDLLKEKSYDQAASRTRVFMARHAQDRDCQIVGNYLWAQAILSSTIYKKDAAERREAGHSAATALERCERLIDQIPQNQRSRTYGRFDHSIVPLYRILAADGAGSSTEVLRKAEKYMPENSGREEGRLAALCYIRTIRRMPPDDNSTSRLLQMSQRLRGSKAVLPILNELGHIYWRKGQENRLADLILTVSRDFPDSPLGQKLEELSRRPHRAPNSNVRNDP